MRLAGRISEWNDDKGYGFVVPNGGGARAFVHAKAFQSGSRRPLEGDLISYETTNDAKGRANAVNVRFAGQRIEQPSRPLRIPRRLLGVLALLAVGVVAALGRVPAMVAFAYLLLSGASYLVYWWDKDAAGAKARRTPESMLHLLDVLGGWPGALIAQQQFRHKTVKASFQAAFWITVLANLVAVAWLVRSGIASAVSNAVLQGP